MFSKWRVRSFSGSSRRKPWQWQQKQNNLKESFRWSTTWWLDSKEWRNRGHPLILCDISKFFISTGGVQQAVTSGWRRGEEISMYIMKLKAKIANILRTIAMGSYANWIQIIWDVIQTIMYTMCAYGLQWWWWELDRDVKADPDSWILQTSALWNYGNPGEESESRRETGKGGTLGADQVLIMIMMRIFDDHHFW